jgi:Flp pilus assembly protein TadB
MSATRPSQRRPSEPRAPRPPRDISRLQARRRAANRRRRLFRLDVGVGVFAAIVLLIATPGLAIAAVIAVLLLLGCVASVVIGRRRRRRRERL